MKNTEGIGPTRGTSREHHSINRRDILESSLIPSRSIGKKRWRSDRRGLSHGMKAFLKFQEGREEMLAFERNLRAAEEKQFGENLLVEKVSNTSFQEESCGTEPLGKKCCRTSANETHDLSSIVVSLGLFDEDMLLFACSGIPVPEGTTQLRLTRFVTSARFVGEYKKYRYKDDKLRVEVCLPDKTTVDGFLGLYDNNIAIVTSIDSQFVRPVGMNFGTKHHGSSALAAGRGFNSCKLMVVDGCVTKKKDGSGTFVSGSHDLTKAVLGGPLVGSDESFLGMIIDIFHEAFMHTIYRLKSYGYPMPPPLVLEFNGYLVNKFEERFGECLAWKGYPFGDPPGGSFKHVWGELQKHVVTAISHRVVSLASFKGCVRHFTCTGLLIKWPGSKATRTVILTSASLVRGKKVGSRAKYGIDGSRAEDGIDRDLRIEVFLPPLMLHVSGNLEYYNLNNNVAIVSVNENFNGTRPEDIFNGVHKSTDKVLAIGRDNHMGLLMASIGVVKHWKKASKLDCKDLQVSSCKIKKAGIGGPLIYCNGSFAGMNFYDGREVTPFLPRSKTIEVLIRKKDYQLPSESGLPIPVEIEDEVVREKKKIKKWPVPETYWCHGGLDVSMYDLPKHIGRVPN